MIDYLQQSRQIYTAQDGEVIDAQDNNNRRIIVDGRTIQNTTGLPDVVADKKDATTYIPSIVSDLPVDARLEKPAIAGKIVGIIGAVLILTLLAQL